MANNLNTTKEQERAELHRAIWQIANDLRGSIDGWDFKQYVLGMLFYRFISENLTSYINEDERRSGKKDFDYAKLSDQKAEFGRADTIKEKGFYILPSELFVNVRAKASKDSIVAILDKFEALVNDISVGLPAELSARRSQYEYYRDKLLSFKELNSPPPEGCQSETDGVVDGVVL